MAAVAAGGASQIRKVSCACSVGNGAQSGCERFGGGCERHCILCFELTSARQSRSKQGKTGPEGVVNERPAWIPGCLNPASIRIFHEQTPRRTGLPPVPGKVRNPQKKVSRPHHPEQLRGRLHTADELSDAFQWTLPDLAARSRYAWLWHSASERQALSSPPCRL